MAMFPKTISTIKNEILPKIKGNFPALTSSKKIDEVTERISEIEAIQAAIAKQMEEERQYSGAFDYYHQTNPTSVSPNVLEQLYGRDLNFLRMYYQINSPIDQLIFAKKFEQFRAISDCIADNPKKKGWRVVHKQHDSPDFKITNDIKQKCRWLEMLIQNPNKTRHPGGFPDVGIAMLESKMLFDRIPIEKIKHADYKKYPNLPASYLVPDAATIKPTTWVLHAMSGSTGYTGRSKGSEAEIVVQDSINTTMSLTRYEDTAKAIATALAKKSKLGNTAQEEYNRLTSGIVKWVQQMPDKQIAAGYTDHDISVFIGNPSPQLNAWGWSSGSAFERSFVFGEVIFKMTGYNHEIFDSRMPEGILSIANPGVDKRQKQQLHERMNEEGTDRYSNLLVQYVSDPDKDVKFLKLKDKPHEMQFREMFVLYVKLKCAAYGLDYTELNLEDGKSGGLGGSKANEKRMDAHAATGIQSDTRYIAHCITKALIEPWTPDYKMEWVHDVDETKEDVDLKKSKLGIASLYETRTQDNLDKEWWKEAPKEYQEELQEISKIDYIPGIEGNGRVQLITQVMQMRSQKEMQEQEAASQEGDQQQGGEDQGPQENPEITQLRQAIGQQEQPAEDMGKSFAVTVRHEY